jgi:hypothetical protein
MGCCDRCAYRRCADGRRAAISIGTVATAAVVTVATAICVTAVITVATAICVAAVIMHSVIMFVRRVRTSLGGDIRGVGWANQAKRDSIDLSTIDSRKF